MLWFAQTGLNGLPIESAAPPLQINLSRGRSSSITPDVCQERGEDEIIEAEARVLKDGHQVYQYLAQDPEGTVRTAGDLTLTPWDHRLDDE